LGESEQVLSFFFSFLFFFKKTVSQNNLQVLNILSPRDFGTIFGDLLPGNSAKLDVLEDKDISEGLEIKVNLGGVWKQSLTELSGGQRFLFSFLIFEFLKFFYSSFFFPMKPKQNKTKKKKKRSLVALSLILSLLCYKPAPLYILDEIDAALDLSHTQNIGQLLKNRFKGAQVSFSQIFFIIAFLLPLPFSCAELYFFSP